ncbi:MAG: sigma-70 family RNA polymerase sigma factor [Myxococcales bacterium]|nr:sigma-70 family RNA polymerase sigma factor [Myxococcales bacterium]
MATPASTAEAIESAFSAHRKLLWGLCYRMSGCAADADDLLQDTFERALRNPPADQERELRPWLIRVAMNASRDHLRKRRRRGYDGPWLPSPIEIQPGDNSSLGAESPEARYGRLESISFAFLRAAEALSPSQRAVLLLRDVLDLSVRETADALEMGEANVKTTHHRARSAMRDYDETRRMPSEASRRAARSKPSCCTCRRATSTRCDSWWPTTC